ncbi:molybdenum cofactor guanylyltransferase [Corallincola luteus]|uniref:Molybdenum cofactor guanylyltransferase n=2 Tax=Corallincola luteus TaxID=1775177 RepID=A0ABY2ANS2_9GAMM|nr:molybdenum cofactor guanylyltransferase [Corallincola luteus]
MCPSSIELIMAEVNAESCCGVVLAGGQSRRMGEDKALLQFHGEPLVARMLGRVRQAGLAQVFVSGDYPDYPHLIDFPDAAGQVISQGPLAGLLSVAEQLRGQYGFMVVVPVDMPLLPPSTIHQLLEQPAEIPAVAYQDAYFPLRLILDDHLIEHLRCLLDQHEHKLRSLRALLERLPKRWLPLPDPPELLSNVNTPEQWQWALQQALSEE